MPLVCPLAVKALRSRSFCRPTHQTQAGSPIHPHAQADPGLRPSPHIFVRRGSRVATRGIPSWYCHACMWTSAAAPGTRRWLRPMCFFVVRSSTCCTKSRPDRPPRASPPLSVPGLYTWALHLSSTPRLYTWALYLGSAVPLPPKVAPVPVAHSHCPSATRRWCVWPGLPHAGAHITCANSKRHSCAISVRLAVAHAPRLRVAHCKGPDRRTS